MSFEKRQKERIEGFLKRQMFSGSYEEPVCAISIRHVGTNSKVGNEIHRVKFSGPPKYEDMENAVTEIESVLFGDVEALEGMQRYAICVTDDGKAFRSRLVVNVQATNFEDDTLESEPANAKGLQTQLMRHLEVTQRTVFGSLTTMLSTMQRTIQTQADQLEKLTQRHFENLESYESLATERHIRDLESESEKARIKQKQEMFEEVRGYLPTIVNRIAGKSVVPEKKDARVEMVKVFLKSIKENQLDDIMKLLTPEQQESFAKTLEAVADNGHGNVDIPVFHSFVRSLSQEQVVAMRGFLTQSQQITVYQIFTSMEQESPQAS